MNEKEFDPDRVDDVRDRLTDVFGTLFGNIRHFIGLSQYEETLEKIVEAGKKAEEHLREYREWKDGPESPPPVMQTEISPGAILEELAPLFPNGGMTAKIVVNQYVVKHFYDTDVCCNLEISWREFNTAEHAKEVYQTLLKTRGIGRVDYEMNQEKRP